MLISLQIVQFVHVKNDKKNLLKNNMYESLRLSTNIRELITYLKQTKHIH